MKGVHYVIALRHVALWALDGGIQASEASRWRTREPQRKRIRFGLVSKARVARPPMRRKPDTGREAKSTHLSGLSGWLGAARADRSAEELFALAPGEALL